LRKPFKKILGCANLIDAGIPLVNQLCTRWGEFNPRRFEREKNQLALIALLMLTNKFGMIGNSYAKQRKRQ